MTCALTQDKMSGTVVLIRKGALARWRDKMPRFTEGQAVTVMLNAGEWPCPARIVENIDAAVFPHTDWWMVKLDTGSQFGVSGAAIVPANRP